MCMCMCIDAVGPARRLGARRADDDRVDDDDDVSAASDLRSNLRRPQWEICRGHVGGAHRRGGCGRLRANRASTWGGVQERPEPGKGTLRRSCQQMPKMVLRIKGDVHSISDLRGPPGPALQAHPGVLVCSTVYRRSAVAVLYARRY